MHGRKKKEMMVQKITHSEGLYEIYVVVKYHYGHQSRGRKLEWGL
jgi:hypothetical protein